MGDRWTPDDITVLFDHKMEQTAKVYLRLHTDGTWVVDDVFLQRGPTDGLDLMTDDLDLGCSCDTKTSPRHQRALLLAQQTEMPNPLALLHLMIDALFPHDTPPDLTDRASIEAWLADPNRQGPKLL